MSNKTCGECRFLNQEYDRHGRGKCYCNDNYYWPYAGACKAFQERYGGNHLTNGNKIRQMNNSNKFCVNCLYHIRTAITPLGSDFCKKMRNPVTGNPTPCMWVRSNPDMCGEEGIYFEKKEPAPQKINFWLRIFRGKKK